MSVPFSEEKMIKERISGLEKAGKIYKRLDDRLIPEIENEIRLFVIARNEELRLPFFFKYYSKLGIDRFFLIDNDSSDNTVHISLSTENVHVFQIKHNFKDFWYWIEFLLDKYGKDRWCMVVDVDELFSFPLIETVTLNKLIHYLEHYQYTAVQSFLLDIYSNQQLSKTHYLAGQNPMEICEFFELGFTHRVNHYFDPKHKEWYVYDTIYGGVRQRVFGQIEDYKWDYCLSKVPLFKHSEKSYLSEGMHTLNGGNFADLKCAMFHTKFMYDFIERAYIESEREVHFCDGLEYKIYAHQLSINSTLNLYNKESIKYENSLQLIKLDLMKSSKRYEEYIK